MTIEIPAPLQELDDAQLMRRVQSDDAQAFGALYDRFSGRAYGLAQSMARNNARAEDVVQEAFLSVWRSRASYVAERGPVASWIMGTVRNRGLDSLRRNGRHDTRRANGEDIEERLQAPGDLEHGIAERDQATRLRRLLVRLPDAQRDVIALAYFGELSTSEIARELSIPHGTVKGRMRLGLNRLRTGLPERHVAQPATAPGVIETLASRRLSERGSPGFLLGWAGCYRKPTMVAEAVVTSYPLFRTIVPPVDAATG